MAIDSMRPRPRHVERREGQSRRSRIPERIDASDPGSAARAPQGPFLHVRPARHVHRGPIAVRPLLDARGHGPLARSFHDRDQPAAVRDARPGEHQRDVRQQSAGGPGPAGLRGRDRGRAERLPGPGRAGPALEPARGASAALARRRPGRPTAAIRCAGCGTPAPAEHHDRRAGPGRRDRGRRVVVLASAAPSRRRCPSRCPHYTTLRELGRGAMGVVYQARHNQTGQMVALKLIMPETATTPDGHRPLPTARCRSSASCGIPTSSSGTSRG